jgi:hypothetical protein
MNPFFRENPPPQYFAEFWVQNEAALRADWQTANAVLQAACGVVDFFENEEDWLNQTIDNQRNKLEKTEFGDFQTNENLAKNVVQLLHTEGRKPTVIFEPSFGKGNFILAALQTFESIEQVVGVEIFKPYIVETKFKILDSYLANPDRNKPIIRLLHQSFFDFDYKNLPKTSELLVIGNPPWVTNAGLGVLDSANLPRKSNFKNHSGLDAMMGKSNFDIGEFITLSLLQNCQNRTGKLAFLVKNQVIKNLVFDQKKNQFNIGNWRKYSFDAQKEFSAAVEASLLTVDFSQNSNAVCTEFSLQNIDCQLNTFGWVGSYFVSNTEGYVAISKFDGNCPFEWRQGMKHDCSAVMELTRENGHFVNGRNETTVLEPDLVFGLLKSSDLKHLVVKDARRFTIVTQRRIGQDTNYIAQNLPKTFDYLDRHRTDFVNRKSSIYRDKPQFSIFGIGDYAFKPYKVAISGLYKTAHFTLVLPNDDKPLMLDDTCYFLNFDDLETAVCVWATLNNVKTRQLLAALTFSDAKRVFTKDILKRIAIDKIAAEISFSEIAQFIDLHTFDYDLKPSSWSNFISKSEKILQISLF